ncbi:MAG: DNA/RNA nuclease SfsA [Faecalibacterium sp.]|nr:DNA/RNA nuclease SfsA [Faecalibacterium sp.]
MQYSDIRPAVFVRRPNRFLAQVTLPEGTPVTAHVKNTGRCAELLVPGAQVYLEYSQNPARKTPCDLVAVQKQTANGPLLINMDSAAPNAAAGEWLTAGGLGPVDFLKPEYTLGDSRFDFYAEQNGRPLLVEVKGCTLETDGFARFPDAPTQRGVKHLTELAAYARQGWRCCALFVIQMKGVRTFGPNWATHPAFGTALQAAAEAGVEILAMDCFVTPQTVCIDAPVPVLLQP